MKYFWVWEKDWDFSKDVTKKITLSCYTAWTTANDGGWLELRWSWKDSSVTWLAPPIYGSPLTMMVVGVKRRSSSLDRVSSASLGYNHIHDEGDKGSGAARISDPPPVRWSWRWWRTGDDQGMDLRWTEMTQGFEPWWRGRRRWWITRGWCHTILGLEDEVTY